MPILCKPIRLNLPCFNALSKTTTHSRTVMNAFVFIMFTLLFLFSTHCLSVEPKTKTSDPLQASIQKKFSITSGIYINSFEKYAHHLSGDVCEDLHPDFSTEQIDRFLVDIFITCRAFEQEGIKLTINLVSFPNNQRARTMVEAGTIDTLTTSIWLSDIDSRTLYTSDEVVKRGQFEKGIYFLEDHPILSLPLSEVDLTQYIAVTKKDWQYDWEIINNLTPKVHDLRHLPSIVLIIKSKRADFMLNSFPSSVTLDYTRQEVTLKPVRGIKVVIHDSRHFIVSKRSEKGEAYFKILNSGLKKLRTQGAITEIYKASGFINQEAQDWKIIN